MSKSNDSIYVATARNTLFATVTYEEFNTYEAAVAHLKNCSQPIAIYKRVAKVTSELHIEDERS